MIQGYPTALSTGTAQAGVYMGAEPAQVQGPTVAQSIEQQLEGMIQHLNEMRSRLQVTRARFFGDMPECDPPQQASKPAEVPNGTIGRLSEKFHHIQSLMMQIEGHVTKLSELA